jgi:hypothetical protein
VAQWWVRPVPGGVLTGEVGVALRRRDGDEVGGGVWRPHDGGMAIGAWPGTGMAHARMAQRRSGGGVTTQRQRGGREPEGRRGGGAAGDRRRGMRMRKRGDHENGQVLDPI